MNAPSTIRVFAKLIRETWQQARASGLLWLLLALTGFGLLFCASVSVSGGTTIFSRGETREFVPPSDPTAKPEMLQRHGVDAPSGEFRILFGLFRFPFQHYREVMVYFLELLLAGFVVDTGGLLLVLIWTAGFLPTFLESANVSVLLARPTPRWLLLMGKALGVLVFVFVQALLFVGGTWLILGLRTGVWAPGYLLCIPLLVLQFAVFFSASLLLAVLLRSTAACIVGSILFWFVCWGGNYGRALLVLGSPGDGPGPLRGILELLYWVLPKPMDLELIVVRALGAERYFAQAINVQDLVQAGAFYPDLSVLTSLLFAGFLFGLAAYRFERTDY